MEEKEAAQISFSGINKWVLALVGVLIVVVLAFAYSNYYGEKEISSVAFKETLNGKGYTAIVQDLREIPANDSIAKLNLQNCAVQLSNALATKGKNVSNYAFEGEICYGGLASGTARPISECLTEINHDGRLQFVLSYNETSKTTFYNDKATYTGDAEFMNECVIVSYVSN